VRREGNPQRAYQLLKGLDAWLLRKEGNISFGPSYLEVRRTRGRILLERLIAAEDFMLPEALSDEARGVHGQIATISDECAENTLLGMTLSRLGDVHQISRDFDASIRCYLDSLTNLRDSDDDYRLRSITGMALDWAYLRQRDRFAEEERKVSPLLKEGRLKDLDMLCDDLQSLARAQAGLGYYRAFTTLGENEQAYADLVGKVGVAPLRSVQLHCSRLEVLRLLSPIDFEREAPNALQLVREYRRFNRHEARIEKMLEDA
jgi:hypothetical protein